MEIDNNVRRKEVEEGRQAVLLDGSAEGGDVLGGVLVGGREAVGDGLEPEVGKTVEGGGTTGLEEAVMVSLGVHEGDVEAPVV